MFAEKPEWAKSSIESPSLPAAGLGEVVGEVLGAWVETTRVLLEGQQALLANARRSRGDPLHLSFREAAARLKVGRGAVLKDLIARGELKTITVQGRTRIPVDEVERLAAVGFDTNSPAPKRKKKGKGAGSTSKRRGVDPGTATKGLKF
jgi:hypothetical protein